MLHNNSIEAFETNKPFSEQQEAVYECIKEFPNKTRNFISFKLGISLGSVNGRVNKLIKLQVIKETGNVENTLRSKLSIRMKSDPLNKLIPTKKDMDILLLKRGIEQLNIILKAKDLKILLLTRN